MLHDFSLQLYRKEPNYNLSVLIVSGMKLSGTDYLCPYHLCRHRWVRRTICATRHMLLFKVLPGCPCDSLRCCFTWRSFLKFTIHFRPLRTTWISLFLRSSFPVSAGVGSKSGSVSLGEQTRRKHRLSYMTQGTVRKSITALRRDSMRMVRVVQWNVCVTEWIIYSWHGAHWITLGLVVGRQENYRAF